MAQAHMTLDLDGVFLDLYGTLTAGDKQAVDAVCARVVADQRLEMTSAGLAIRWGERFFAALDHHNGPGFRTLFEIEQLTLVQTLAELDRDIDPHPYTAELREYWRNPPLQPEVKAFLRDFTRPICIVSNADRLDAEMTLARHEIAVHALVTSEDARSYKPDAAIFEQALARTGWRRDRVMHVGDSLHSDVGGARSSGLHTGWVNRAHRIHDIGTHEPDFCFDDLLGLARLVGTA